VLERLLAGVSQTAKRAVTVALIAIAWIGFFVAVISGLVAGLVIIVIGFIACWLVVATLAGRRTQDPSEVEPLLRPADVEPDDVQTRVRKRLEALNETGSADAARERVEGEDA
jgi:hypothetical protein